MTDHITWHQTDTWHWLGTVGGLHLFLISEARAGLLITTDLPEMPSTVVKDKDDLATAKRICEAWLRDFVAGLGAIFKDEIEPDLHNDVVAQTHNANIARRQR